ncbi:hypothetical protein IP92_05765 [Pseudoduganella flava]|uniref:Antitermination protein n=1 Tax=Pseudoduganella flava TaxID=871742 RepID=A0A562P9B3_9BURK|nr:hypothetical protein [Pseudoduganella flava]QGZ42704.1 hypothetical protein GO485_29165 [Pseudoduganella flava]TWI41044.1 hypothetical protein IP92_05765 [Pseudoduganella flava]
MTERRDIGWRLENWARVVADDARRPASSQTGAICDRMRKAAEGTAPTSIDRRQVDEADAWLIERTMPQLPLNHRLMLWWCYIRMAQPEVVCRKMGIPHRPATEFVEKFRAAQAAIEALLEREGVNQ